MSYEYNINIDGLNDDLTGYFGSGRWINADALETFGDNLSQCINNAVVFTCDQDGGSMQDVMLVDLDNRLQIKYIELIKQRIADKL